MIMKATPLMLILISLIFISFSTRTPQAIADQVSSLPDYYNFTSDFQMYSGYLRIQQQPQISIHYILITSMQNSQNDPVTLWLNGGPGCSSLLGFAQQVGPNMLLSGSKTFSKTKNPYSWNKISNMLFFQSPAGVGYSINQDKTYNFTDPNTAADGLKALQQFYIRFPEFKPNNFWIAGESYCGMYIPFLANQILQNDQTINLKGILIGNGAMLLDWNWRRMIGDQFWKTHYYYGPEITELLKNCKYTDDDDKIVSCARGMAMANRAVDSVNPYMTTGVCYDDSDRINKNIQQIKNKRRFSRIAFQKYRNPKLSQVPEGGSGSPCTDDIGISEYFNREQVKRQLHIKNNVTWQPCSQFVGQNYHMNLTSLELFENFRANSLKILLYSGNVDAVVPYQQTQAYIEKIGWLQNQRKTPVVNNRGSLMGWKTRYEGLTYVVINGAGHMVPSDKPHAAFEMFKDFILDTPNDQKQHTQTQ